MPGDGLRLPSVEVAFLAQDDVLRDGPPALYLTREYTEDVEILYVRESVRPNHPFYMNLFDGDFSGFNVGTDGIYFGDTAWRPPELGVGIWIAQYTTADLIPILTPNLPAPGQMTSGPIYANSTTYENPDGSYETALTSYTLRLNVIPEPSPASLLALGLIGIVALMSFRKLPRRK